MVVFFIQLFPGAKSTKSIDTDNKQSEQLTYNKRKHFQNYYVASKHSKHFRSSEILFQRFEFTELHF